MHSGYKKEHNPIYFDHPFVLTEVVRLQTTAHICASREAPWGNCNLHFHGHPMVKS